MFTSSLSLLGLSVSGLRCLLPGIFGSVFIITHGSIFMLSALKSLTDNCIISVISVLIPFNWLAHSSQYFPGSYYNRWFLWKPWCFIDHALSVPILFKSSVLTYLLWQYPTWWRWDITSSLPRRAEDHVPIEHPLASKGENSLWLLFWGGSYNCLVGLQWTLAAGRDGST